MSEVAKMYENAGVKPKYSGWLDIGDLDTQMEYIQCDTKEEWDECVFMSRSSYSSDDKNYDKPKMDYPPFTKEKQIELIKTIERKCDLIDCIQIVYRPMEDLWKISIIPVFEMAFEEMYLYFGCDKDFSTALAMAINNLWQDLTEEEKQQVKGILE